MSIRLFATIDDNFADVATSFIRQENVNEIRKQKRNNFAGRYKRRIMETEARNYFFIRRYNIKIFQENSFLFIFLIYFFYGRYNCNDLFRMDYFRWVLNRRLSQHLALAMTYFIHSSINSEIDHVLTRHYFQSSRNKPIPTDADVFPRQPTPVPSLAFFINLNWRSM